MFGDVATPTGQPTTPPTRGVPEPTTLLLTGLGLLCAATLGGGLAWAGPTGYLVVGVYALYTQWHHPALTTPWIWPARPPHDLGAAICAGLVFTIGMAVFAVRGARDPAGE